MIGILLLLVGALLSVRLIRQADPVERVAYTLLLASAAVPWVAIHLALFGGRSLSGSMVGIVSAAFLLLLTPGAISRIKEMKLSRPGGPDLTVLAIGAGVALFAWRYFSNSEFLLSLASYLQRGEAKCFPMQTFRLISSLNSDLPGELPDFFGIISTPGNALFTAPLMPIFGIHTARIVAVLMQLLLFLFTFLLLRLITRRYWISIAVALFAVVNPYSLSIEVLDRNLMAFALSAALFYTVMARKGHWLFHGALFGITAGTGLRFLPLTFLLPILLWYFWEKTPLRGYLFFFLGFAPVFPFNIPHLLHHGFNSLGETTPMWALLWQTVTQWPRTPLMPYPNGIFYLLNLVDFWGLGVLALVCFGAIQLLILDRRKGILLILAMVPTWVVLSVQKDWIEGDKARILLTVFLPLMVFLAVALSALIQKGRAKVRTNIAILVASFGLLLLCVIGVRGVEGRADTTMNDRKPVYQSENRLFMDSFRKQFDAVGLLPDYRRLCLKTDISRKRKEEQALAWSLFGPDGTLAENEWVRRHFRPEAMKPPAAAKFSDSFINVRIDLEKLVARTRDAVRVLGIADEFFVNFENEKDLLDIYHKEVKVSWQGELLPVTILPGRPEYTSLKELNIELNAFIVLGRDDIGFVRVNMVNFALSPMKRLQGMATAMTALPQTDDKSEILLRVPRDATIFLRDWVVDGTKGTPHRIDSWKITFDPQARPDMEFFCFEPESYL